jgi:hypothetical protein
LLSGVSSDLAASVAAVQLAGRTESLLYVLQGLGGGGAQQEGLLLVTEFAALEGVKVNCHLLAEGSLPELAEFLTAHAVTWLVVGGGPEGSSADREKWLDELRARLRAAPNRFCSELQVIVAPPLAEGDLKRIISQARRLNRQRWGKISERQRSASCDWSGVGPAGKFVKG